MKFIEHFRILKEKVGSPIIFLLFSLLIAGVFALFDMTIIKSAIPIFIDILAQVWYVLIIVFGLLFLSNLFLTPKAVKKWLSHASGWKGWLLAVGGGILSSGPIYLWYPLLSELEKQGMRKAYTATFLYNRAVKPALLPLLITYFGITYTLVLTVYMILFSIIQGSIIEKILYKQKNSARE
ncbi:hypothetical protein GOV10_06850 [Candidatus Woesearchaeota archaeon]|nr:hypothetical protein [Candidatus Woesearchaeota archaeon]